MQLRACEFEIVENLAEKPGANCFACVYRNHRGPAIRAPNKVMATFNANDSEPGALQRAD